ncbi:MAG: hypothetical protein C0501_24555 [Isosphaera sp.]|nr:hypothetical protein [Isosphaera sp.]
MAKAKPDTNGEKKESNMGMVRAAMQELGADAKPLELQAHIRSRYGAELATNIISNYKFQIRSKGAGRPAGAARGRRAGGPALRVEDFEAVRGLVSRLGADQVKRLVDVVG